MDSKAKIKWDYRGDIREYLNSKSKNCLIASGRVSISQVWSRVVSVLIQGGLYALLIFSSVTHNAKAKVI